MSSVLPYFDALLGIFEPGFESRPALDSIPLEGLLMAVNEYKDFRPYMPAPAQRLIQTVEDQATVCQFVTQHQSERALIDAYNAAINSIVLMRSTHVSTVDPYIGTEENNKGFKAYGTGGSDYRVYFNALKSISESSRL